MASLLHFRRFGAGAALAAISFAGACERQPLAPAPAPAAPPAGPPVAPIAAEPTRLAELQCTGDRQSGTIECEPKSTLPEGVSADIIVGGQNRYVRLTSANVDYNSTSQQLSFTITLKNLIPQAMGTTDGVSMDPNGIRIFFETGPTVTGGTGSITVANPDGFGTFTGTSQPYFQYNTILPQDATTLAKQWILNMPTTALTFAFSVYISAPVQFPNGYVKMSVGNSNLRADGQRQVSGKSQTPVGNDVTGTTLTWSTNDPSRATVDPATGLVSGVREGAFTVSATDGTRSGQIAMNVTPIQRFWTAGAGTTNFHSDGNYSLGVAPTLNDSVDVPAAVPQYPQLFQNASIANLNLQSGATMGIGAFDLTLSKSLSVNTTSGLTGSSGRVLLTGTAQTIYLFGGQMPQLRVLGSYSLSSNVSVINKIVVQGGRLRVQGLRLRVTSQ